MSAISILEVEGFLRYLTDINSVPGDVHRVTGSVVRSSRRVIPCWKDLWFS